MGQHTTAVVVGAGHSGLAASHALARHGVDHVVLERGEAPAHTWRTERWDSLRLLTPNWLNRLPDHPYAGPDPDGYLTAAGTADHIAAFAVRTGAPVRTATEVTRLSYDGERYAVRTTTGDLTADVVVLASGMANAPSVPAVAAGVPDGVTQVTAFDYRNPDQLPEGGVLVVGASATGVQLAAELQASGRPVTLSVGEHVRLPRTYRDRDVLWWMQEAGVWAERYDEVDDLDRARRLPSPQLLGSPDRRTLDLNALTDSGVSLVGRLAMVRDGTALFSGGLRNVFALADLKQQRLLDGFDAWAAAQGRDGEVGAPERPEPTRVPATSRLKLDLAGGEVRTVLWATGYRPVYDWLDVPVLDAKGRLRHDGGVLATPGLYALGLPVLRRRGSTFLHGAEADAREVVDHAVAHLAGRPAQRAAG